MLRDISLHILDLVQNSVKAKADKVEVGIGYDKEGFLHVSIEDNGCGMSPEFLAKVEDPFTTSRTTRKVGMGIPFFKLACLLSGGDFSITSEEGKGTCTKGSFLISNIDRLPLGNVAETMKFLIMDEPDIRYILKLGSPSDQFVFDTDEIKEQLGDVPLSDPDILQWIEEYIKENVLNIFGGVLDEVVGGTEGPEGESQG